MIKFLLNLNTNCKTKKTKTLNFDQINNCIKNSIDYWNKATKFYKFGPVVCLPSF